MRHDMGRVIIERPRVGGGRARFARGQDSENVSGSAPMRPRGHDRKELTNLWGPLRRFLRSHVGRPWNKVWSEICEYADARSVVGTHLRAHVHDLVETRPIMQGKAAYSRAGRPLVNCFYVNPRTRLLCRSLEPGRRGPVA